MRAHLSAREGHSLLADENLKEGHRQISHIPQVKLNILIPGRMNHAATLVDDFDKVKITFMDRIDTRQILSNRFLTSMCRTITLLLTTFNRRISLGDTRPL
jgi:hypothetical protein